MPPQSIETAETLAALKRALRREKEAPSDQPITSATNRGNKLKKGANFVRAGSLPYRFTRHGYKEKIDHAGYARYILSRNPRRYNEFGDEVDESESDAEADADADDENPYSDIRLEDLLRPLTHASELEHHPTLSRPYLDTALPDMVLNTEEKLRQERANLWRAKNLHRQFVGDESWIPCEVVEAADDWDLFEPAVQNSVKLSPGKKRKRNSDTDMAQNGIEKHDHADVDVVENTDPTDMPIMNGDSSNANGELKAEGQIDEPMTKENGTGTQDIEANEKDSGPGIDIQISDADGVKQDGTHPQQETPADTLSSNDTAPEVQGTDEVTNGIAAGVLENGSRGSNSEGEEADSTPPPPPRRITRALAAGNNGSSAPTPPLSPASSTISSISTSLLQADPIFLLPPSLSTAHSTHPSTLPLQVAHSGLPIEEILETRRLLGMYIQKQEETIRGLESVLGKLIKAKRMKTQLWEWCKNEGHVGEWSDGEDWIDSESWGVKEGELRKGRDEDEVVAAADEEPTTGGRGKGKRRRGARE